MILGMYTSDSYQYLLDRVDPLLRLLDEDYEKQCAVRDRIYQTGERALQHMSIPSFIPQHTRHFRPDGV